jgi:hypothetical protein
VEYALMAGFLACASGYTHEMRAHGQRIGASAVSGPSGFELRFSKR